MIKCILLGLFGVLCFIGLRSQGFESTYQSGRQDFSAFHIDVDPSEYIQLINSNEVLFDTSHESSIIIIKRDENGALTDSVSFNLSGQNLSSGNLVAIEGGYILEIKQIDIASGAISMRFLGLDEDFSQTSYISLPLESSYTDYYTSGHTRCMNGDIVCIGKARKLVDGFMETGFYAIRLSVDLEIIDFQDMTFYQQNSITSLWAS